jgi:hypothetical protein
MKKVQSSTAHRSNSYPNVKAWWATLQAEELTTLTGTELILIVASEGGNLFSFATPKWAPIMERTKEILAAQMSQMREAGSSDVTAQRGSAIFGQAPSPPAECRQVFALSPLFDQ